MPVCVRLLKVDPSTTGSRSCKTSYMCSAIRDLNYVPWAVSLARSYKNQLTVHWNMELNEQSLLLILIPGDGKTYLYQILAFSILKFISANSTARQTTRAVNERRIELR